MSPSIASSLTTLGRGLADAPHHAQQIFRALLDAIARPGRLHTLPAVVLDDMEAPPGSRALWAALLTLLDAETTLHLGEPFDSAGRSYLRFHTGVAWADAVGEAAFVAHPAAHATPALWRSLCHGSDEAPQSGATLLLELPALSGQRAAGSLGLRLRGPGIEHEQRLWTGGLAPDFWQARQLSEADYPLGVDLLLFCGDQLAALPRSTGLTLEN